MYVGMRLRYPALEFARLLKYKYIEYTYQTELLTRAPKFSSRLRSQGGMPYTWDPHIFVWRHGIVCFNIPSLLTSLVTMRRICQGVAKSSLKSCHRAWSRGYATCLRWTLLVYGQWFALQSAQPNKWLRIFSCGQSQHLPGLNTTQSTTRTVSVKCVGYNLNWSSRWWGRSNLWEICGTGPAGVEAE